MTHKLKVGAGLVAVVAALGIGSVVLQKRAVAAASGGQAPRFEVDPLWPKPLPNHWVIGNTIGVSVDAKDHIWIIHRGGSLEAKEIYASHESARAECCTPAPPVLEFDRRRQPAESLGRPRPGL